MSPNELADAAERVLADPGDALFGCWARASALLARQSLETAMDLLWRSRAPLLKQCSMASQLLVLPSYLRDQEAARDASYAWAALSRACHHHAYELAPTSSELRSLIQLTRRVTAAIETATAGA
ncbi:MAG TPA: hypothetical protein VM052_08775 [Candidatus Limnocylindrales bacterium]|nr:hypothetical protein [Candidatus Limnocylindrales bacterium]